MKKITTTIVLASMMIIISAQTPSLIRKDTIVLNASECKKINTSILASIEKGNLKAIDPFSGKMIPSNKIFTWNLPTDTVAVYDKKNDKTEYKVVQGTIDPSKISKIKIYQDWFLGENRKLFSKVRSIDLMIEVSNSMGDFIGYKPFCRINYDGIDQ